MTHSIGDRRRLRYSDRWGTVVNVIHGHVQSAKVQFDDGDLSWHAGYVLEVGPRPVSVDADI